MTYKLKNIASLIALAGLCACGSEGSGNLTVSAGTVSSSAVLLNSLNMSESLTPLADASPGILANSGIDPTSFLMRIYAVGFSKKTDCTEMTVVELSDDPDAADWVAAPMLATTSLPDGTYPCVAFEMNPTITITPEETSSIGNCIAGTPFNLDVGNGGTTTLLSTGETGTISDRMAVYISTTGSQGDACGANCATTPGDPTYLSSPLVVSGSQSGQFTVDALGSVADSNGSCEMDEPTWGFQ